LVLISLGAHTNSVYFFPVLIGDISAQQLHAS